MNHSWKEIGWKFISEIQLRCINNFAGNSTNWSFVSGHFNISRLSPRCSLKWIEIMMIWRIENWFEFQACKLFSSSIESQTIINQNKRFRKPSTENCTFTNYLSLLIKIVTCLNCFLKIKITIQAIDNHLFNINHLQTFFATLKVIAHHKQKKS